MATDILICCHIIQTFLSVVLLKFCTTMVISVPFDFQMSCGITSRTRPPVNQITGNHPNHILPEYFKPASSSFNYGFPLWTCFWSRPDFFSMFRQIQVSVFLFLPACTDLVLLEGAMLGCFLFKVTMPFLITATFLLPTERIIYQIRLLLPDFYFRYVKLQLTFIKTRSAVSIGTGGRGR